MASPWRMAPRSKHTLHTSLASPTVSLSCSLRRASTMRDSPSHCLIASGPPALLSLRVAGDGAVATLCISMDLDATNCVLCSKGASASDGQKPFEGSPATDAKHDLDAGLTDAPALGRPSGLVLRQSRRAMRLIGTTVAPESLPLVALPANLPGTKPARLCASLCWLASSLSLSKNTLMSLLHAFSSRVKVLRSSPQSAF